MGGFGSGNRWRISKTTCEESKRIDLRYMRRNGMLKPGRRGTLSWARGGERAGWIEYTVGHGELVLDYSVRNAGEADWKRVHERFILDWTPQPFGGGRLFVRCLRCSRKCLVLYGGAYFRCRKCHNLAYKSQSEDPISRMNSKSWKIRKRLGDDGCFEDPMPEKPKGMHWKTYNALIDQCQTYEDAVSAEMLFLMSRLGKLT